MRILCSLLLFICFILCSFSFWIEYNSELKQAYNWAYDNWVTTQDSIDKANMMWNITRAELAKMIVWYLINVIGDQQIVQNWCEFTDLGGIDESLKNGVLQSCYLWIMWQWIIQFRPNDVVTRAEFGTVLSRMLWWDKYGWGSIFYEKHLKALNSMWIMNNISSPQDKEVRWYVMLMLMRSVNGSNVQNIDLDNQIFDIITMLE